VFGQIVYKIGPVLALVLVIIVNVVLLENLRVSLFALGVVFAGFSIAWGERAIHYRDVWMGGKIYV
jgi:hypothetical protein